MSCPAPTFVYANWIAQYPEFGSVAQGQAQSFFNRALQLVPWNRFPPQDPLSLTVVMNAATAHFAYLFASISGQAPRASGAVGRLAQATEGSVSAQFAYADAATDSQAFWNQSEYGAFVWVATLPYRTGFYVPGPRSGFGAFGRRF